MRNLLFVAVLLSSCINHSSEERILPVVENSIPSQTALDQKINDVVWAHPLVRAKSVELRKINPDIRLVTMIVAWPEDKGQEYLVDFSESQETHVSNIYRFTVNKNTFKTVVDSSMLGY